MLYRVTMFRPMKNERGYEACESWIVGSLRHAELTAKDKLSAAAETDYSARCSRHPFVEVRMVKRFRTMLMPKSVLFNSGKPLVQYETPIVYVPSVGDLGWTP